MPSDDFLPHAPPVDQLAMQSESIERLLRAIDVLPELQRLSLYLHSFEDLSYREIAEVLGGSEDAAAKRVQRARRELRRSLRSGPGGRPLLAVVPGVDRKWLAAGRSTASRPSFAAALVSASAATTLIVACLFAAAAVTELETVARAPTASDPGHRRPAPAVRRGASHATSAPHDVAPKPAADPAGSRPPLDLSQTNPRQETLQEPPPTAKEAPAMKPTTLSTLALATAISLGAGVHDALAVELGDVNGDGRVSFADAFLMFRIQPVDGAPNFAGTIDCTPPSKLKTLVYFESLRRISPEPMPHFIEAWPRPEQPDAFPPVEDSRVLLEVLDVEHKSFTETATLLVRMQNFVDIDGVGLVLRAEGLDLRPPEPSVRQENVLRSTTQSWLITRGRLAYRSSLLGSLSINPGETIFELPIEIPRGSRPGTYTVELLEGTELVSSEGDVIRPEWSPGSLRLDVEIETGHRLPFPDLILDEEARRVEGGAEFRLRDVVPEGRPGDSVQFVVQAKLGRPVNHLPFLLSFDGTQLIIDDVDPLIRDPSSDEADPGSFRIHAVNAPPPFERVGYVSFLYSPSAGASDPYEERERQPSLTYIGPSDEWVDVAEVSFTIDENASGGETPLHFDMSRFGYGSPHSIFRPYMTARSIWSNRDCRETAAFFSYEETTYHDSSVVVIRDGDPIEPDPPVHPETAEIRFFVGEEAAKSGGEVRVPVAASTQVELYQLRLVLDYDLERLEFDGVEVEVVSADGERTTERLTPDDLGFTRLDCTGKEPAERQCEAGFPVIGRLHAPPLDEVPDGVAFFDLTSTYLFGAGNAHPGTTEWSPGELYELGELLFRVRPDAPAGFAEIRGVDIEWRAENSPSFTSTRSSGWPILDPDIIVRRSDVPAIEVTEGGVRVLGDTPPFLRGDADRGGDLEITDAVRVLSFLFQGAASLPCEDSADANDDGAIDLTDAIFTLDFLFRGGRRPPPPYPKPGHDETADRLGCER